MKKASLPRLAVLAATLIFAVCPTTAQAGFTVGLDFVTEPTLLSFPWLYAYPARDRILPWQMTQAGSPFVSDGAFAGMTEQQAQAAVLGGIKQRYYSVPTPAGTVLDVDFVLGRVSGVDSANVLIGKYWEDADPGTDAQLNVFGLATKDSYWYANGSNDAFVALDEIATVSSYYGGSFDTREMAVNAIGNVAAHEVGHWFNLDHVAASYGLNPYGQPWQPSSPVVDDPYDVMATGPSGLPSTGWLLDNRFSTVQGTQEEGLSSVDMLIQNIGLRMIGDTDQDSDVDGSDYVMLVRHFTGPGGFSSLWSDGDFDFDGDVDGTDYVNLVRYFTGPLGASNLATLTPEGGQWQPSIESMTLYELMTLYPPPPGMEFSPVPEPATMAILAVGVAGLIARRRRVA